MFIIKNNLKAQDNSKYKDETIENAAENAENSIDASSFIESLEYLHNHPIDLNKAVADDFEKLGMLTPFQINNIIEYKEKHGSFLSVFELNGVDGLPVETIEEILPYITVDNENLNLGNVHKGLNQMFMAGTSRIIELQNGYRNVSDSIKAKSPNSYYLGNSYKVMTKYQLEYNSNIQAGLTTEKDQGEIWFSNNKTFDFASGYLQYRSKKYIKNIIIGDYNVKFGQGLVFWNGFAPGRGTMTININKFSQGFDHFASYNENGFMRGIASTVKVIGLNISTFFSNKKIDANITSIDSTGKVISVSTFQNSGVHALPGEVADEKSLGERVFGSNINYYFGRLRIGATFCNIHYDAQVEKTNELYNKYAFSGNAVSITSIDYIYKSKIFETFGEVAKNDKNAVAAMNGITSQLASELSIAAVYRHYQPAFWSPFANAFGQTGQPTNENGLYYALEYIPSTNWKINAYADFFKYPWLKYQISQPSSGSNYSIACNYNQNENLSFSVRYTIINKMIDTTSIPPNPPITVTTNLQHYRFQENYKISESFEIRNRIEISAYAKAESPFQNGFLFSQDILWKPNKTKLSINAKYIAFYTDNYNCRIYSIESDLKYSYSVPAYSGKGSAICFLLNWRPIYKLTIIAKYSEIFYSDRNCIGTGPAQINGNCKTQIGIQAICKF